MTESRALTSTEILAAATEHFSEGGYRRVEVSEARSDFSHARTFEDEFGIVKLVVFETWSELVSSWTEAQGALVEFISEYLSRSEPKAWEGYLVLLTPGVRGKDGKEDWMRIRYNTKRIRKLVASGEDLKSISDVRAAVAPLLPLDVASAVDLDGSVLDLIPELLEDDRGIAPAYTKSVILAFETQRNMLQALHDSRTGDR